MTDAPAWTYSRDGAALRAEDRRRAAMPRERVPRHTAPLRAARVALRAVVRFARAVVSTRDVPVTPAPPAQAALRAAAQAHDGDEPAPVSLSPVTATPRRARSMPAHAPPERVPRRNRAPGGATRETRHGAPGTGPPVGPSKRRKRRPGLLRAQRGSRAVTGHVGPNDGTAPRAGSGARRPAQAPDGAGRLRRPTARSKR